MMPLSDDLALKPVRTTHGHVFLTSGAAHVVVKYLRTTWLWDAVRVQGGAYGGFRAFDHRSGNFTYLSYRDPNLLGRLDIYDQTPGFLKRAELDKTELH